jgi:transposase
VVHGETISPQQQVKTAVAEPAPAYVKPYVKLQKNDEADAEAICEAVTHSNVRFAEVKTIDQQSVLMLHRTRTMLIKHRTRMGDTIRAHLAESGITEAIGREGLYRLII